MKTLSLFIFSLMLSLALLPAQEVPAEGEAGQIIKEKAVVVRSDEADIMAEIGQLPYFPNLEAGQRYYDEKAYAKIQSLHAEGEATDNPLPLLKELDALLMDYTRRFGTENFRLDYDLLWMAGGVKHLLGDTIGAIHYYELAKMHDRGNKIPDFALTQLQAPTKVEWLPIDQYYKLLEVRRRVDPLIFPKAVLERMPPTINSDFPDYAPYLHPTDSILIFTSRRDFSGMRPEDYVDPFSINNEDLYFSERDFITGDWTEAMRISDTVNSSFNEGSACLAPDGVTLYFTRCREDRGFGSCDIYTARYDPSTGEWGHVQNLGSEINSKAWDSQPNIAPDGRTLFFVSNRNGGFGGTDIYYATRDDESGRWSPAKNIGPMINTAENEVTPYFHRINETLYFSSTGHLKNYGSYDIFKSRWKGDRWEFPENLGPLINTDGNQYYFTINGRGTLIFYSNSENPEEDHVRQNFDLYAFPMPMEARPDAVAELKGYLVDSVSGFKLRGTVMILDLEEGVEVAPKRINEDGYFEFDLVNDRRYRLFVLGDNFLTLEEEMVLTGDTTFTIFTQSFEENKPIVFESMEFRSNSAKLKSSVKPKLDYIVRFLETYPMFKLEVEGHTDAVGREESNLRLSQERADAIADYLTRKGNFAEGRITAKGYGETRPLVPNDTEENRRQNRRVEFKLALDDTYEGDLWLPTEAELFFGEDLPVEADPNFDSEFDWSESEEAEWAEEIEAEDAEEALFDDLDLESELESDIIEMLEEEVPPTEEEEEAGGGSGP
ncbi:MAG: OmpA family protein [Bacteroidetes bacterium]|nr:MAG: OmpA family protein [Bacteroidota bacterium]